MEGLDKAIEYGKEKRKPYYGCRAIDHSCRNHGSCEWCKGNRMYQKLKQEGSTEYKMKEYEDEEVE